MAIELALTLDDDLDVMRRTAVEHAQHHKLDDYTSDPCVISNFTLVCRVRHRTSGRGNTPNYAVTWTVNGKGRGFNAMLFMLRKAGVL